VGQLRQGSLEVRDVSVDAWGTRILSGVGFSLHPGEMCALVGPSGAGKSTLVKVLLGLRSPSTGSAALGGGAIGERAVVGYVPQQDALHDALTVRQALGFAAELRLPVEPEAARATRLSTLLSQVGLADRADVRIRSLSGGQKKRVSVAMELLTDPALLILDEPTAGLDPGLEARMMALFQDVASRSKIVLVATHAMESIDRCSALLVLVGGRVAWFGPPRAALPFFHVEGYAAIFDQLPKQKPEAWSRTLHASREHRAFAMRRAS
jgi:ABC-type multidrug transport system ATPase subunit